MKSIDIEGIRIPIVNRHGEDESPICDWEVYRAGNLTSPARGLVTDLCRGGINRVGMKFTSEAAEITYHGDSSDNRATLFLQQDGAYVLPGFAFHSKGMVTHAAYELSRHGPPRIRGGVIWESDRISFGMNDAFDVWVQSRNRRDYLNQGVSAIRYDVTPYHTVQIGRTDLNGEPIIMTDLRYDLGRENGSVLGFNARAHVIEASRLSVRLADIWSWIMQEVGRGEPINPALGLINRVFERYFSIR